MLRKIFSILTTLGAILFVVGATILLVAFGRGYSYDFKNHRATLNGLVIMNSTPSAANVILNGKDIKRRTPYRATLEAGDYSFEVKKDGYRTWSKQLKAEASEVVWVQYIWLLPEVLKDTTVTSLSGVAQAVPSNDHRHLAMMTTGVDAAVLLYDNANKTTTKLYQPLAATTEQPAEALTSLSWADDNAHLLLRSKIGVKVVVQILATGQAPSNLTDTFKYDFATLSFAPGNWHELFWQSPEGLRKLDVGAQTVSAVLADNVLSFALTGNRVLYVQTTKLGRSLYSMDMNGHDKKELVQSLAESESYQIVEANYRGADLLAVLPTKARTLTLYSNPDSDNPTSRVVTKDADYMSFNGDGRFLNFGSVAASGTYDSEKTTTYNLGGGLTGMTWFDNYHILGVREGRAHFLEFDGANDQAIGSAVATLPVLATSDQHSFLRFAAGSDAKLDLISTDTHK